jgi:O-antigen/teichoic acid export membrane protein
MTDVADYVECLKLTLRENPKLLKRKTVKSSTSGEQMSARGQHSVARTGFLGNVATVLGGQAATVAVALLTEVCTARLVGPSARGQISLCMMAIACGTLIGGLGADIPIVIWTADRTKKVHGWLSAVLAWGSLGFAGAAGLWWMVFSRWHLASLRGVTPALAKIILLTIPFAILLSYITALLIGTERFRELAGVSLLRSVTCFLAFLALTVGVGRNAEAFLWGNLAGILLGGAGAGFLLRKVISESLRVPSPSDDLLKGLAVGLRGQVGNVAAFFNYRLDVFIVNYFLNPAQVGLYAIGVVVSEALWQIPQAVATTLFPRTARTINEGASNFTCLIIRQVCMVSLISAAAIGAVSSWAVPLVFGTQYSSSVPVIWWLLPGTVAMSMAKVAASDLAARSKTGYSSAFGLTAFVVTVILDLVLIPRMGIRGAALASSIAYFVNGALLLIALKHELKVRWLELLVPTVVELSAYKRAWTAVAMWSRAKRVGA